VSSPRPTEKYIFFCVFIPFFVWISTQKICF
jgi:hypothetical protein